MPLRARVSAAVRDLVGRLPGGRRLKAEFDQCERQRDRLRDQVEAMRLRGQARGPSPDILRQVLPLRRAAFARAGDPDAPRLEAHFAAGSASYREAIAAPVPGGVETVLVDGLAWLVPAGSDPRSPLEEILQARELALGGTMLDIGANVGTTAITRVLLGDVTRVFAAEPDPVNYACLVRNVADNSARGRVLPDRVAISDHDGTITMQRGHSTTHHLVDRAPAAGRETVDVPCLRLDSWVRRLGIDLDALHFIKVDTQGWEARVLAGAPEVLARRHIVWQLEFTPSMLRRAGSSAPELFALLRASFTHFIDMRGTVPPRSRAVSELADALAYVGQGSRSDANLLLYNAA